MLRIPRFYIGLFEFLEAGTILAEFTRPRIHQPHVDALCLGAEEGEVVNVRSVEGADE